MVDKLDIEDKEKQIFISGIENLYKKEYLVAVDTFSNYINLIPKSKLALSYAYYYRGICWLDHSQPDKAFIDFNKAIETGVQQSEFFTFRGVSLHNQKQYKKAILDFTNAISLDPNSFISLYMRASSRNEIGDFNLAIEDLSLAIELAPHFADSYYKRGIAFMALSNNKSAISDFTKSIQILMPELNRLDDSKKRTLSFSYYSRALIYEDQKIFLLALDNFKNAINIMDDNYRIYLDYVCFLLTCPEKQCRNGLETIRLAQRAVQLKPNLETYSTLALSYAVIENFDGAINTLREALSLKGQLLPEDRVVLINAIKFYESEKKRL